jgi:threonine aldolase
MPPTSLICVENAHSLGRPVPLAAMEETKKIADEWKLPIHLDGARIFNAAVALGCNARDIASMADSVMFCLSKGLCAPVGSLLAGKKKYNEKARYKRKIMGGGMRQAGILAAAGIIALEGQIQKIKEDHNRTKNIARGLAKIPGIVIKSKETEINLVFFTWPQAKDEKIAANVVKTFKKHKIIINHPENGVFRFVTHYWIGDAEVEAILAASKEAFNIKGQLC